MGPAISGDDCVNSYDISWDGEREGEGEGEQGTAVRYLMCF